MSYYVAQVSNLLYRGLPVCCRREVANALPTEKSAIQQVGNLRYIPS
jgi:hypothetical protein